MQHKAGSQDLVEMEIPRVKSTGVSERLRIDDGDVPAPKTACNVWGCGAITSNYPERGPAISVQNMRDPTVS
jgi:hypothetical protein